MSGDRNRAGHGIVRASAGRVRPTAGRPAELLADGPGVRRRVHWHRGPAGHWRLRANICDPHAGADLMPSRTPDGNTKCCHCRLPSSSAPTKGRGCVPPVCRMHTDYRKVKAECDPETPPVNTAAARNCQRETRLPLGKRGFHGGNAPHAHTDAYSVARGWAEPCRQRLAG
jgi:hypothetical protein